VAIRKKTASAGLTVWTVAELGAFYTEHRSELHAHASRILKDSARAEEVIQDALIKVMLAAPELESTDHALSYMHRTIENLCIDIFRLEGRRPNLVVLDEATTEVEAVWQEKTDHADVIAAADDAAIIRQALAMLSPAERAALVMWEMEGRSTEEIARELGIKESSVRHTVSRARTSLRRVLSELVIDEARGLTALDLLSTTYKKAAELAQKSSKAALSLILVFFAFLGFNSLPSNTGLPTLTNDESVSTPLAGETSEPRAQEANPATGVEAETPSTTDEAPSVTPAPAAPATPQKSTTSVVNAKTTELKFQGLDKQGIPTGFTVADTSGGFGPLYTTARAPYATETELVISQILKTDSGAANIFISQSITTDAQGLTYSPVVSFGLNGQWAPLKVKVSSTDITRLSSGNYLFTAYIGVESVIDTPIRIGLTANGRDLATAPRQVITRAVLDPSKTKVLAQAIYVVEQKGTK
jgi:RNA polymerase sigma factor (sigma-70 family)